MPDSSDSLTPKRGVLGGSYDRLCSHCRVIAVHKNNTLCLCPDCAAELRRGLKMPSMPIATIEERH